LEPAAFCSGNGASVRERFGLGTSPVILSFGHVIPLRDRVPLVRALPLILERIPDAKVLVVGQVYTETFLEVARELGVQDAVVVAGRVEHAEVPDVLAAADVEGHDHTHWGLGITSLEVMAAGVPVFAVLRPDNYPGVDLGQWPDLELLADGSPETLSASVIRLLNDRPHRDACVEDQHAFVSSLFTMRGIADRYLDLFQTCIREGAM
jgi:glycosyltransferase involved in cell wall biosynthesis